MKESLDVNTGRVVIGGGGVILRAVALGSCIAVAVYDCRAQLAGIAHVMLPGSAPANDVGNTKYALSGIDAVLAGMSKAGASLDGIDVFLVGAGNVLQKEDDTICSENIKSVTGILLEKGLPVRASVLGGTDRKSIFLDSGSGRVSYTRGNGGLTLLWPCSGVVGREIDEKRPILKG